MRLLVLIILIPILFFSSCDKDAPVELPPVPEIDNDIELYVYYQPKESISDVFLPDFEAKVYVYFDLTPGDPFSIEENGVIKFIRLEKTVSPAQTAQIDESGYLRIEPLYRDRVTLIIVESKYYSGVFATGSFYNCKRKNTATFNFTKYAVENQILSAI